MGIFDRNKKDGVDPNSVRALPYNAHRPLTASASRLKFNDKKEAENFSRLRSSDPWQIDAWNYFDAIGEVKSAALLVGAILSRVRLFAAVIENPDEPPVPIIDASSRAENPIDKEFAGKANRALQRLGSAHGGLSGLVARAGMNIWVAGECNLVQVPARIGSDIPERWDIKSISELVITKDGKTQIKSSRNGLAEDLPPEAFKARIWRSHAQYSDEADSSLKAVREACDELLLYSRLSRTVARSRMNAGMLLLPDGLAATEKQDGFEDEPEIDPATGEPIYTQSEDGPDEFEDELMTALTTPIADESSASAVVPGIIRGPADQLKEVRLLQFERTLDPQVQARADRALERILQGLDLPKDMLSGFSNVRYSNAKIIEESLYTSHIEPLILLICDALTAVYLRPALEAMGYEDLAYQAVIWYDPTEILTAPDRNQAANDGHDRKIISDDAWRRLNGLSEADAPSPREVLLRTILDRAPLDQGALDAVFKLMDPNLFNEIRETDQETNPAPLSDYARKILDAPDSSKPSVEDSPETIAPDEDVPPTPGV